MIKNINIMVVLLFFTGFTYGQSTTKTINLKKGEVLDILLLRQNQNVKAELNDYFKTAYPVALRMTYQALPGFKIKEHVQGNLRPENLILGKWRDVATREEFLKEVLIDVPDFHQRRRKIWSYVGLSYYEMKKDISIEINKDRYHVGTAYWFKDKKNPTYAIEWLDLVKSLGGEILIELEEGKSPFGYRYSPDLMVITSWKSEEAFHSFSRIASNTDIKNVLHLNEFILETP